MNETASTDSTLAGLWIRCLAIALGAALFFPIVVRIVNPSLLDGQGAEKVDFASWGLVLLATGLLLVLALSRGGGGWLVRPSPALAFSGFAFLAEVLGIIWFEPFQDLPGLWGGFGTTVLLAALALVPILYILFLAPDPRLVKFLAAASLAVVLVVYLPSVVQPAWGAMEPGSALYTINEVLAPAAHVFPLSAQVPQYTTLFGYPLVPLLALFHPPLTVAFWYLSVLAVATVAGIAFIAFRILPQSLRPLALLLTVPLILVKVQPPTTSAGSIASQFSALPLRALPVVVVGIMLLLACGRTSRWWTVSIGLAAGIAALNNFEFGIPTLIAAAVVCALWSPSFPRPRPGILLFLASAALPLVLYFSLLALAGQPVHPQQWFAFILVFGSGFGSVPMPLAGTHLLVMMLLVAGAVTGAVALRRGATGHDGRSPGGDMRVARAASVATFFGLAGIGSFGYYVGRSITSTQLQVFLIYLAPVLCAQLGMFTIPRIRKNASVKDVVSVGALLLPVALLVASVLQAPDARYEWSRVSFGAGTPGKPSSLAGIGLGMDADLRLVQDQLHRTDVVGAVPFGNVVYHDLGLPNYSVLDQPTEASRSGTLNRAYCARLADAPAPIYTQGFFSSDGVPLCPGFEPVLRLESGAVVIQALRR